MILIARVRGEAIEKTRRKSEVSVRFRWVKVSRVSSAAKSAEEHCVQVFYEFDK